MNIELLEKIKAHILEEPRRLDMGLYFEKLNPNVIKEDYPDYPPCGTVGCIAGWALMLTQPELTFKPVNAGFIGGEFLGISKVQRELLFFVENWPEEFKDKYEDAMTPLTRAEATVARINFFIKTGGTDIPIEVESRA